MIELTVPSSNGDRKTNINLKVEKNVMIIGANGTGKTRFGSRLEVLNPRSKRISAQRSLELDEVVEKLSFESATTRLNNNHRNQPPIKPQTDYRDVLALLFAEEAKRNETVVEMVRSHDAFSKKDMPQSVKEKVLEIWSCLFPYRQLNLTQDRVRADEFSGKEMSDGERVGLYLIAQVLLAEPNVTLIVDEPELHLHKALMVRLWNKLEEYRSDCTFIYITHDLDFAVSKPSTKLIWMQKFQDNGFIWQEVDANEVIPESLFLEVLGSRKTILFVEGDKGSLDMQLYQSFYENFTVIPCGSCEKVIEAVKGLRAHPQLHGYSICGLIDRDCRTAEQLEALETEGIFSIGVNEVENLFLVPEVVEMVCGYLSKEQQISEIMEAIRGEYSQGKANVEFATAKSRMIRHLGERFGAVKSREDLENFKAAIGSELDEFFDMQLPEPDADIRKILEVYPHKGLITRAQEKLEVRGKFYKDLVMSFLSTDEKRQQVMKNLKPYLPDIA